MEKEIIFLGVETLALIAISLLNVQRWVKVMDC
jgi:hypothetical protein